MCSALAIVYPASAFPIEKYITDFFYKKKNLVFVISSGFFVFLLNFIFSALFQ